MANYISNRVRNLILIPILLISISAIGQQVATAQNDKSHLDNSGIWEKAKANAAGGNYVNGVDVFYRKSTCNAEGYLLLKFVNNNTEAVLIEWADGIYTQDKQWIHNERNDKVREVKLKAKEQIEGSCEKGSSETLQIHLEYYLSDPEKAFQYAPSFIDVTK